MSSLSPAIRWSIPAVRVGNLSDAARLTLAGAAEGLAVATLLFGPSLHLAPIGPLAATGHGLAVALVAMLPSMRPSRCALAAAAVLTVPIAGMAIAVAAVTTRGRGLHTALRARRTPRRPRLTVATMRRLAGALSPCDALACGDADERRRALSALARREDPEAIALLRRAVAGGDPDLALSAALVLDEIGERAERRGVRLAPAENRRAAG